MQKKILVLAIAAAISAPAFADTTVYGLLDAAVAGATAAGTVSSVMPVSGGLAGSRLGVKATEKLDNGVTAVAVLEYGLDSETGVLASGTGASRQTMLALAGDFGTVATGYLQTAGYDWGNKYDVVGGSSVTPLGNITAGQGFYIGSSAAAKRAQRAVAYISPNMSGLVVALNYSAALAGTGNLNASNTAALSQTSATLASVDYTAGKFAVGGVYLVTNSETPVAAGGATANVTEFSLGASYDMGFATVKATFQDKVLNATGAAHNDAASVGATIPAGSGTVVASYAMSTIATDATKNSDAVGYTVGYLQGLSKTTTAYVAYSAMSQGNATNAVSVLGNAMTNVSLGGTSSVVAAGLSKKF